MKKPIPFGKYLLLDRVNVGGMAEVFLAKTFGVEGFERVVAIKKILPTMVEDQEFITMFIDEARIAVQLNHANIVQIYELGKHNENYFIAMEYVSGRDLRTLLDRFKRRGEIMPQAMAVYVAQKMCEGLDYAHRKKDARGQELHIVHRDVSPQNVILSFEGDIKIIDFGIAKAANRAQKTQAGILKGKFGYMSPEQVRGLPIDGRSDIFAVGVCLYEMLTGEKLFIGESDFSTLEKVRNADVPRPREYNGAIPEGLEAVVLQALTRDVEDRFQFASDMQEALMRFLLADGTIYNAKHLASFMHQEFDEEMTRESDRMERYSQIAVPGGVEVSGVTASRPQVAPERHFGPPPPEMLEPANADRTVLFDASGHFAGGENASADPFSEADPYGATISLEGGAVAAAYGGAESGVTPVALDYENTNSIPDAQAPVAYGDEDGDDTASGLGVRPLEVENTRPGAFAHAPRSPVLPVSIPTHSERGNGRGRPLGDPVAALHEQAVGRLSAEIPSHPGGPGTAPGLLDEATRITTTDEVLRGPGRAAAGQSRQSPPVMAPSPSPLRSSRPARSNRRLVGALVLGAALAAASAAGVYVLMGGFGQSGSVTIHTVPDGDIEILVDGKVVETRSPAFIPELAAGPHVVTLRKPGTLAKIEQRIEVVAGGEVEVRLTLKGAGAPPPKPAEPEPAQVAAAQPVPAPEAPEEAGAEARAPVAPPQDGPEAAPTGTAFVDSTPSDAYVDQDGKTLGRTPYEISGLDLEKVHRFTIRKTGYRSEDVIVSFDAGTLRKLNARLEPLPPEVAQAARAATDGNNVNKLLEKAGEVMGTQADTPPPRKTVRKPPPPRPPREAAAKPAATAFGSLVAATSPVAKVKIDGKDTGRWTPVPPANPIKLSAGEHEVEFELPDGQSKTFHVTIKPDEATKLIWKF